jgi:hypothetical protein
MKSFLFKSHNINLGLPYILITSDKRWQWYLSNLTPYFGYGALTKFNLMHKHFKHIKVIELSHATAALRMATPNEGGDFTHILTSEGLPNFSQLKHSHPELFL